MLTVEKKKGLINNLSFLLKKHKEQIKQKEEKDESRNKWNRKPNTGSLKR